MQSLVCECSMAACVCKGQAAGADAYGVVAPALNDLFVYGRSYGGRLPERQAVEMVLQPFLHVLHYLHQQGILHRCACTHSGIE